MKIEDTLKKQGEIYKNLNDNKVIQESNETIKPPKLVQYEEYLLSEQEHEAITELERRLGRLSHIVDGPGGCDDFEISIKNNKVTYLRIKKWGLKEIPEQINKLTNLERLDLYSNNIKKINNLSKLVNLERLDLAYNKIKKIKGLDNLTSLKELFLKKNPTKDIEEMQKLRNKGVKVYV